MPPIKPYRVLCVDDDEDACEMLSSLLQAEGLDVTCAGTAAEAWVRIKTESFDLYMLDGWLPHLSGFDFCREIREFDLITPILFYSGAAYETDKQKGFAAGANAYVTKPEVETLIRVTLGLVAGARVARAPVPYVGGQHYGVESEFSTELLSAGATATDFITIIETGLFRSRPRKQSIAACVGTVVARGRTKE